VTQSSPTGARLRARPVVAIDGPAGAGKSTVTRRVAQALDYTMVDTGALYRTVALACLRLGVGWDSERDVGRVASQLVRREALEMKQAQGATRVLLEGEDVSAAIRTQDMGLGASVVSAHPAVREALLELQRQLGRDGGVVLEGRDIGTVVFPDAEAKFFLTASAEVRAARRRAELVAAGHKADLEQVLREVLERDRRDSERPIAPLVRAPDAELIDSSHLTIEQAVESIVGRVREIAVRLEAARTRS
jgi:CMP/dCMP kinase